LKWRPASAKIVEPGVRDLARAFTTPHVIARSTPMPSRRAKASAHRPAERPARGSGAKPEAARPTRTRRSAAEARQRILEAAQKELMRVGPEALRLTDLARALQISHPAILHHFGSRGGLVAAVVRHSLQNLHAQLIETLAQGNRATDRGELIELVASVCGEGGLGRLLAWLLLSDEQAPVTRARELPLRQLADAAFELRTRLGHNGSYEDTLFEVQLLAITLLGDAIFGDAVRRASGAAASKAATRDFRLRLARLLAP
jgi:AcrR family transcriptional regulator